MKTNYELRYACDPRDAKNYDTTRLREDFLIPLVFTPDEVNMVYSMYDSSEERRVGKECTSWFISRCSPFH